ncbi:hypothetical protein [Amycolatopsis suaedae]|uniref:Uncharacterized protein n=1 Tax=Amycolatopsis suaedae TaxID=2510978 RepID=A0A4Q7J596_9PSEU|nr:hypothetical protein [Amycolatopsis suaedae]RZQ62750.1 hypothetical protein EWH70_17515 [Amycolatopsis suaedae]
MSDQDLNLLAIWIFVPSAAIALSLMVASALGFGTSIKKADRERQLGAFRQLLASHHGPVLDVDWMLFKTLSKQELLDLAAPYGWRLNGQEYGGKHWWLRLVHQPSVPVEDPRARLAAELAAAEPGADGKYLLDSARYSSIPDDERDRVITQAGWKKVHGHPGALALARIGTTVMHTVDEPMLEGLRPAELRRNPVVAERAKRFHAEHGFDPLGPSELDRLRIRNNYWTKKFFPPGCIASFLLGSAPFPFFIGLSDDAPTAVYVGIGMAAVALVPSVLAWLVRRRRKAELGPHLAVLRELKALHRSTAGESS